VVLNKADLTGLPPMVERDAYGRIARLRVSARSGDGLELLRDALAEYAQDKLLRFKQSMATGPVESDALAAGDSENTDEPANKAEVHSGMNT
jgi:GTPase